MSRGKTGGIPEPLGFGCTPFSPLDGRDVVIVLETFRIPGARRFSIRW